MINLNDIDWSTLPTPTDDGGTDHLLGLTMPSVVLEGTDASQHNIAEKSGLVVIYTYPMTGRPDVPLPEGWDMIPGARGCTPQSCSFRDHTEELNRQGVQHLYGISTQSTQYQKEAAERLHLPFPLLSDFNFELTNALKLPTFDVNGSTLLKRITIVVKGGVIVKTFYPVFPPDTNAQAVLSWIESAK